MYHSLYRRKEQNLLVPSFCIIIWALCMYITLHQYATQTCTLKIHIGYITKHDSDMKISKPWFTASGIYMHAYYEIMRNILCVVHNFCASNCCIFYQLLCVPEYWFNSQEVSKSKREIWMAVFLEDIFYIWDMECIFYIGHSLLYWTYVFYIILTMHCNESKCFLFCFLHVKNSTCYILYNNIQGLSHSKSLHWH